MAGERGPLVLTDVTPGDVTARRSYHGCAGESPMHSHRPQHTSGSVTDAGGRIAVKDDGGRGGGSDMQQSNPEAKTG
jgi:hypothetical protein